MRPLMILLVLLTLAMSASAQPYFQRVNTVYLEALGSGGVLSANFERLVSDQVAVRVGLGSGLGMFEEELVVPATVSYLLGQKNSYLELGVGMAFVTVDVEADDTLDDVLYDAPDSHVAGTGVIGYRYMGDWGLFMRLAFTPMVNEEGFVPLGGAAFGFSW